MTPPRFKYPRTFHLPYSLKKGADDKVLLSDEIFAGKPVVVTEKMDGENTTVYSDYLHARSIDSDWDESKRWLDRLRSMITHDIPAGWRLCGENLFYKHTIHYTHLETLFYVYSMWDENNSCLSWPQTLEWCKLLQLKPIPVIYEGIYSRQAILNAFHQYSASVPDPVEGFVVRIAEGFSYKDFSLSVAKFVTDTFQITTSKHWKYDVKELNQLRNNQNVWEIIS
ncbi:RNA ligase family protein [Rhodocytophaga rosea]|uniref:RNA ligase family protein n=1 Tax=Rhodocytophaga rosea TaxID=2704465 RepID=A0A6C0GTL5_9BACT|nr:RNA ligase family protein [Rhodocytophaga rosea]QHT71154.1 RNA ligase family protein [Rhodocytophaga rosea]